MAQWIYVPVLSQLESPLPKIANIKSAQLTSVYYTYSINTSPYVPLVLLLLTSLNYVYQIRVKMVCIFPRAQLGNR